MTKWPIDQWASDQVTEMTKWPKWPNDKLTEWPSDWVTKWQVTERPSDRKLRRRLTVWYILYFEFEFVFISRLSSNVDTNLSFSVTRQHFLLLWILQHICIKILCLKQNLYFHDNSVWFSHYFIIFGCESSPISRNVRSCVRPSVSEQMQYSPVQPSTAQ